MQLRECSLFIEGGGQETIRNKIIGNISSLPCLFFFSLNLIQIYLHYVDAIQHLETFLDTVYQQTVHKTTVLTKGV